MKSVNLLIAILFFSVLITSCGPEETVKPQLEKSTVLDKEGNKYNTVKIGNQWWMAEDLKATKFQSGKEINLISLLDTATWANSVTPAFTKGKFGNLYNFYSISNNENIAPEGWHVATEADWQTLESFLGMSSNDIKAINWRGTNQGDLLKEDYQNRIWKPFQNIWGTNERGFAALPCGCRMYNGKDCFPNSAEQGFWWTTTTTENEAWFRNLDYKKSSILRFYANKKYGFAIRCVKD